MPDEEKHCYLSALAPELFDNILSHLDSVRTLGNLITTSRFVYRHFEGREGPIILRVLQNELGPVLTDAKFLCLFPYTNPPGDWIMYWDKLHTMAAMYRDMLGCSGCSGGGGDVTDLSFAELTQLCRTLHKMNFLASTYVAAQLRLFGEGLAAAPPSRTEWLRVLRAFYRRQIVCNAWAPTRREPQWMDQDTAAIGNTSHDHQGERPGLFAAFEPWELQQVDHADRFVTRLCTALCLAREEAAAAQPIGKAEFGDVFSHVDRLVQHVRENPGIADAALRTPPSRRRLSSSREFPDLAAAEHRQFVERYALPCLQFAWQSHRLERFPDPARDQRRQQQEDGGGATVDFVGDAVDLPPFGWVDALDGYYVNWFGDALVDVIPWTPVPDEDEEETYFARDFSLQLWRDAGFTLWDQRRVESIKELDWLRTLRTGWLMY